MQAQLEYVDAGEASMKTRARSPAPLPPATAAATPTPRLPADAHRSRAFEPLCAICVTRVGTELDEIDGRLLVVCVSCRDEAVPDPGSGPSTRERILRVLRRSDGLDIVELSQALGEDNELGRAKLCAALIRAKRAGLVTFTGARMDRTYHLAAPRSRRRPKAS